MPAKASGMAPANCEGRSTSFLGAYFHKRAGSRGLPHRLRLSSIVDLRQNEAMITPPLRVRLWLASCVLLVAALFAPSSASASDVEISIDVKANGLHVRSTRTEIEPSPQKPPARPVCRVKAHEDFVVSWKATNVSKGSTFKDVLIHCVVVPEKEPGQLTMPSLKDPTQESALTMDFKPGSAASGKFSLAIDEPGAYLLRVETREMLNTHGHEHYAALDLICE